MSFIFLIVVCRLSVLLVLISSKGKRYAELRDNLTVSYLPNGKRKKTFFVRGTCLFQYRTYAWPHPFATEKERHPTRDASPIVLSKAGGYFTTTTFWALRMPARTKYTPEQGAS